MALIYMQPPLYRTVVATPNYLITPCVKPLIWLRLNTRAIGDRMSATSAISKVISIQFSYFYHGGRGSGTLQRTPYSKYFVLMIF